MTLQAPTNTNTQTTHVSVSPTPVSHRLCVGLGVQADCYIYDDVNRNFGVDDADYHRWEKRIHLLRPGVARVFIPITDFDPAGDGRARDWHSKEMKWQYRNLQVLKDAGASVNLCMGPWTNEQMMREGSHCIAVDLLEHLVCEAGFDNIRWLSLFNEPDAFYTTGGPHGQWMCEQGFGGDRPFSEYVQKHQATIELLEQRSLAQQIRLVIGDMAWAPKRRLEWLEYLQRDFGSGPASYSFHHYVPDDYSIFDCPESKPFKPPPLPDEMRTYRDAVGEAAQLVCWEFNEQAWGTGTAAFCGTGPYGEDHLGTFDTAVWHTRKVLTMLGHGVDGLSHWCAGDMFYRSGLKQGVMYCGLWRYKWEGWAPRPMYFYYAALVSCFRPGCRVHRVEGLPADITGLAAATDDGMTVALLNSGEQAVSLSLSPGMATSRLRIVRERFPRRPDIMKHEAPNTDEPLSNWETLSLDEPVTLTPRELTLLR